MRNPSVDIYAESAYDHYLCLKPTPLMWLSMLWLSREITLPLIVGMAQMANVDPSALAALRRFWALDFSLVPAVIAALVLVTFFRRVPKATRAVRWIFGHGAKLLSSAAALDALLILTAIVTSGQFNDQTFLSCVALTADVVFLVYLLLSRRVRNTFKEFPAPEAKSS